MPDALTMNSSSGADRSTKVPAAISSACSAFHFSTDAVRDAHNSELLIDSGGVKRPVPVIDTDGNVKLIPLKLRTYRSVTVTGPRWVRASGEEVRADQTAQHVDANALRGTDPDDVALVELAAGGKILLTGRSLG